MRYAHGAIGGVDMLPASARRAIGINAAVTFININLNGVINNWIYPDRRKTGMAASVGIERRNAHQPVYARFRFQPAIGIVALDQQGR